MSAAYDPVTVEAGWYDWWRGRGLFEPPASAAAGKGTFSMVLPPPNVTGALHIGHALTIAVQDSFARWHRMAGDDVLWVPGLDHAGIATQSVVERRVQREQGLTRHDLGRERFLDEVWQWKEAYGGRITTQLQRLGASLAWDREVFTLDDARSAAVVEAFETLFARGRISRRARLVNWCPHLRTAISDIEVDTLQLDGPTDVRLPSGAEVRLGVMDTFAYPLEGWVRENGMRCPAADAATAEEGVLLVSTTRLETMLGDVAVAVHPEDARYAHLIGQRVLHPITGRPLPIVGDSELVDPEVGTGAVKITPAHDPDDFACAQRHDLPLVPVLDDSGRMAGLREVDDLVDSALATWAHHGRGAGAASPRPDWAPMDTLDRMEGMGRFQARATLRTVLGEHGLYRGQEPRAMALALCSRSGDVLEPMVKPQWWVDCRDMADRALADVEDGRMEMQPPHARKLWRRWLEKVEPWCVSRQLWWGHRIPAFRVHRAAGALHPAAMTGAGAQWWSRSTAGAQGQPGVDGDAAVVEEWVVAASEEAAWERLRAMRPEDADGDTTGATGVVALEQDEDVLDTWFSSALFPLAALGWPLGAGPGRLEPELERFYPLSVMETGEDILFFWVARMAMVCSELTVSAEGGAAAAAASPPFDRVLLHSIVRDKQGRKMSKSLGNVIDPIAVIEGRPLDLLLADLRAGNLPVAEERRAAESISADFPDGIPECGTDALRFSLASYTQQGAGINMDVGRVQHHRFFSNKLWQATRFVLTHIDAHRGAAVTAAARGRTEGVALGLADFPLPEDAASLPLPSRACLSQLAGAAGEVNRGLGAFHLGAATSAVETFVRAQFCDVFIEWCKADLHAAGRARDLRDRGEDVDAELAAAEERAASHVAVLAAVLDGTLRLLHPFMPYITETLWQRLHRLGVDGAGAGCHPDAGLPESISLAPFPGARSSTGAAACDVSGFRDAGAEAEMQLLTATVSGVRALQARCRMLQVDPRNVPVRMWADPEQLAASGVGSGAACVAHLEAQTAQLQQLLRVPEVAVSEADQAGHLRVPVAPGLVVGVPLPADASALDALVHEAERLENRARKSDKKATGLRKRLAAPGFAKAPEHVQAAARAQLEECEVLEREALAAAAELREVHAELSASVSGA